MRAVMLLQLLFASALAFTPASRSPMRHAFARQATVRRSLVAATSDLTAADDGCDPDAPPPPTLAGEKVAVAVIGVAVIGAAWKAGITPASIWALPGTLFGGPIFKKAATKAMGGGLSGALAGVIQVLTLMWLRTTMNYQYRYGTSTKEAMKTLYEQGGIKRFYQGVSYALFQTPLARFGDTAANTGVLELLSMLAWSQGMPMAYQTAIASAAGSLWRICITPIDTLKTTLQVEGAKGYQQLMDKIACEGPTVLFQGALANAFANFVGSYPWFFTFNLVMARLPAAPEGALLLRLLRSAIAGVSASCVSDVVSNVVRVLKTTRQTSPTTIGYREAAKQIIDKEGVKGLFTRGLGTRLITNAIQATLFSIVWKFFEYRVNG